MNGPGNLKNRTQVQVPPDINENIYEDIAKPNVYNIGLARLKATAPLNINAFLGAVPNQLLRIISEGPSAITIVNEAGGSGEIKTSSGTNITLTQGIVYNFTYDSTNEQWLQEVTTATSTVGTLTPGAYLSGGTYNGSGNVTWDVEGSVTNTPSTLVARDAGGDIYVGDVNAVSVITPLIDYPTTITIGSIAGVSIPQNLSIGTSATVGTSLSVGTTLTVTGQSFFRDLLTSYPASTTNPRTNWPSPFSTARGIISAASGDSLAFIRGDNGDTSGATIILARTGNLDPGILSLVAQFDTLGTLQFRGATSSTVTGAGGAISVTVEGIPGASSLPSAMHFSTTGSSLTATRRWTINESGHLHPATTPASDNIYDIGLTGTRVRTGYFGTSVIIGSSTISSTSASFAGTITVTGTATLNGNVVIGDNSADTLTIAPNAVTWSNNPTHSGNHTFSGNVTINGNTAIGNATSDTLSITARLATGFDPSADNVRQLGTGALRFSNIYSVIFTGNLVGNASTASAWQTPRTITIGATGKSVDGSANVSWSLAEIGAQAEDADLTAIAALGFTATAFLKKTALNTWALDTNVYLTGNQTITISGDASGSGATAITLTLATVNTNIGTFNNVTVNAKGLVTAASNVAYLTGNQTITLSGDVTGSGATSITTTLANSGVVAGTYGGATTIPVITVDAKGRVTSVSTVSNPAGDVVGPGSATDNAIARFDGTTGKLIKNSGVTIDNNANIISANGSTALNDVGMAKYLVLRTTAISDGGRGIEFSTLDGSFNPRAYIYHTGTPTSQTVTFDSTFSSGSGSANWIFATGKVGVNTTAPSGLLGVAGASGQDIGFNVGSLSSPVRGNLYYTSDGTGWKFQIGKWQSSAFTPQMTFEDNGRVGIGIATASSRIHIDGDGGLIVADVGSTTSQVNIGVGLLTAGRPFIGTNTSTNILEFGTRSSVDVYFIANSAVAAILTSSGNFGVGSGTPSYRLQSVVSSATDADIFLAGMSGVTNGITYRRISSVFELRLAAGSFFVDSGDITISNLAGVGDRNVGVDSAGKLKIISAGTGDVTGPASSTDNAIVRFDGTGGKTLQNSGVTVDDSDNVTTTARMRMAELSLSSTNNNTEKYSGLTSVSTSATTIAALSAAWHYCIVIGSGVNGAFCDIVVSASGATPVVISSTTLSGTPAARTYTMATANLRLTMGSSTYDIGVRTFNLVA